MKRRIILHIGSPKCGSTYLQQVMLQNRDALARRGIRYPHDGGGHPGNAAHLTNIDRETLAEYFSGGIHTVVLSHEDLYSMTKRGEALAVLTREEGIVVQVIAFLRPFSEFIYGDFSQFMKQYFDTFLAERAPYGGRDFEAFAQRRITTLKPANYLCNWQTLFPDCPLILSGHRGIRPVMNRLFGTLVCEQLDWTVDKTLSNQSLRMQDCDRIAAAMRNSAVPDKLIRDMFIKAFHHVSDPDAGRTPERTAWLESQFTSQNAELMKLFFFDNRHPDYRTP
ncbi:hypothetical protein [Sulfitobacter sp.]|uniref:hypothetical protein n=1 Tax=Sulfitobacter sp. TaxID=1903071 RepID=UPI003001B631